MDSSWLLLASSSNVGSISSSISTGTVAVVNPATMDLAHQYAFASSLLPGRSLSPEDVQFVAQRESFKVKHHGHEGQHLAMFLIFIAVLAMLPATVKYWRRNHPLSYRLVSMGSISLIPPYFAAANGYHRFVTIWLLYAAANIYILYQATRRPLQTHTPRRVYQWFAFTNKASYAVFMLGFFLFILCFFNIVPGFTDTEAYLSASMLTLFYGLYFGLMSRDLVTLCSDNIAAALGYSGGEHNLPTKSLPREVCCVCGDGLGERDGAAAAVKEPTHVLGCGHEFHATCIRGWCVVGKRDVCPFCREKVDLEPFKRNPWDKQELFYVTALEYMRFFVSWQPLTVLLLTSIYWILGLS
ncbi:hypothetical protein LPJ66_000977 [Kickxella alabastrina]|uniref:Uncharacterized protein n=1 Tax=Kickxella alabastrina TaxID=61397 RepID=A0ACC1IUH7_9FUNG|nr:hypothetical protein LPJ66_000977 [Kickxella alabastrina]